MKLKETSSLVPYSPRPRVWLEEMPCGLSAASPDPCHLLSRNKLPQASLTMPLHSRCTGKEPTVPWKRNESCLSLLTLAFCLWLVFLSTVECGAKDAKGKDSSLRKKKTLLPEVEENSGKHVHLVLRKQKDALLLFGGKGGMPA